MTPWYSGNGWGWCSMVVNIPAMVLLWVAVFTAIVLAVRLASRRTSDPPAPTSADSSRAEGVVVGAPRPRQNRQRRIFPPIDVAARETLIAKLIHHRPTLIEALRRSFHG